MTPLSNTTERVEVELPWPDRVLSPNSRSHWAVKAHAVKAERAMAWALTLEALSGFKPDWTAASLHWVFHPKTKNTPDRDNCIASCKAAQDGIADALGIDDRHFTTTYTIGEPIKGGLVRVSIEAVTP